MSAFSPVAEHSVVGARLDVHEAVALEEPPSRRPARQRRAITEIGTFHDDQYPRIGLPERLLADGTE